MICISICDNLFVSLCNVFFSGFLLDVLSLLIKMKLP